MDNMSPLVYFTIEFFVVLLAIILGEGIIEWLDDVWISKMTKRITKRQAYRERKEKMKQDIEHGDTARGGIREKPTTPPPEAPKGQGCK